MFKDNIFQTSLTEFWFLDTTHVVEQKLTLPDSPNRNNACKCMVPSCCILDSFIFEMFSYILIDASSLRFVLHIRSLHESTRLLYDLTSLISFLSLALSFNNCSYFVASELEFRELSGIPKSQIRGYQNN